MSEKIKVNGVMCGHCSTRVVSQHRHDFKGCRCPNDDLRVYVDGGPEYIRRSWGRLAQWKELDTATGKVLSEIHPDCLFQKGETP
jgi:hypothetical protein